MPVSIVVVEDDQDICEILKFNLELENFQVTIFHDGEKALDFLIDHPPDLLVLDLLLPGMNGLEIARTLRAETLTERLPILMLTARSTEDDILRGFEKGADDYLTKPFRPKEFIARVQALLRRSGIGLDQKLSFRDLQINFSDRTVLSGANPLNFTPKEFKILQALYEAKGRVLSRFQLLSIAWGYDYDGEPRTVDVHVRRLRAKLGDNSDLIQTVTGFGYRLHADAQ